MTIIRLFEINYFSRDKNNITNEKRQQEKRKDRYFLYIKCMFLYVKI